MATIDYAAICEAIDERPSLGTWPNVRKLGKNRVDVPAYPVAVQVPMLIAARLSADEAQQGPKVVEGLNVVAESKEFGAVAPKPVRFGSLTTGVSESP